MNILTAEVVRQILELASKPGVQGVALFGSVARGDATEWSDIDVHRFADIVESERRAEVHYIGDRLVMVATDTVEGAYKELADPAKALWAVPAFRSMRILMDPDGRLAALHAAAAAFDWEPMRATAAERERRRLVESVEYLHKIRGAIARRDESAVLHAERALAERCTRNVVNARGVFIPTENEYFRLARDAAGPSWSDLHRRAFGLDGVDAFERGTAACLLYAETVRTLDDILDEPARRIIARALAITGRSA